MSPAKTKTGERLPYLPAKLKAPRVLERSSKRRRSRASSRGRTSASSRPCSKPRSSPATPPVHGCGSAAPASPALKTLEDFDWSAQPSAEKPLVLHLARLAWIEEHANVCFFGPPGTGKTHCETSGRSVLGRGQARRRQWWR